jgi:hypothetical protein
MRIARALRAIAIAAAGYALLLVVTGGFDWQIGSIAISSHNIERFVTLAILAGALSWILRRRFQPPMAGAGSATSEPALEPEPTPAITARMIAIAIVAVGAGLWGGLHFAASLPDETQYGDMALIELYTREAATGDLDVGPYSRYRWHHPGPAMFYLLAPLYEWSGRRFAGLRAGSLVFNLAMLAILLAVLARRGPPLFAVAACLGIAVYAARVPDLWSSPWNPHLIVLPMGVLVAACAAVAAGDSRFWPVIAALGSFVIQSHLSVGPGVAVLVATTVVLSFRQVRANEVRRHAPWILAAVVVAAIMWLPAIRHELSASPGNLRQIFDSFFIRPDSLAPMRDGLAGGLHMLGSPFLPGFELAWGGYVINEAGVFAAIAALAPLLLIRRTAAALGPISRFAANLSWLSFTASLAALWSTTRIQGDVMDQLVFWFSILGVLNLACMVTGVLVRLGFFGRRAAARPVPPGRRPVPLGVRAAAAIAFAAAAVAGVTRAQQEAREAAADVHHAPRVRALAEAIDGYLRQEQLRHPRIDPTQSTWSDATGVVLDLHKRGHATAVAGDWVFMFGPASQARGVEDSEILIVRHADDAVTPGPGFVRLGEFSGVSVYARPRRPSAR